MTYRELFDAAIGETPPTAIDLDRVIKRQRRLVRVRRVAVCGVAAGAVLAVTLGAGLMVDRQHKLPTTAPSAHASRPPYRISNNQRPSEYSARYRDGVAAAVAARVPGVRWTQPSAVRGLDFPTSPTSDTPFATDSEDYRNVGFSLRAYPVDPQGAFGNQLWVSALAEPQLGLFRYIKECGRDHEDSCALSTGPGGAHIREIASVENLSRRPKDPEVQLHYRRVDVLYPDGTWIVLNLMCGDGRFLLTQEQLRELALDPVLRPTW
ncbi:hypothetical protein [Micromonospora sp. NPDC005806]|uniref:hypothetical protein n=1 Tax=Micromonospora sp. NPDC005806 TaxID=3364234 RepID=UPI00369A1F3F